jgi:predicted O-methyltransferase YrrM
MAKRMFSIAIIFALGLSAMDLTLAQAQQREQVDDQKVEEFLNRHKGSWGSWNVPYEDGQILYDLIIDNKYTRALEIGTSTGHSGIWMAWALSKTGGKLITIEIDEVRHKEALKSFEEAGVAAYVDARLADAHDMVKALPGPFDFVFSDADKSWYKQYFLDLDPKLEVGGCFTAHNVTNAYGGVREFLDYVKGLPNYKTIVDKSSRAGLSISYKKK